MNKKEFMDLLLCAAIQSVTIVSVPDYNGGRQMAVFFNEDEVKLGDFEYIEFSGDATEVSAIGLRCSQNTLNRFTNKPMMWITRYRSLFVKLSHNRTATVPTKVLWQI